MRITRRQLRRIILEAISDAPEGGIPVKGGLPTRDYPEAVMILDAKELTSALGVTSRYKDLPQYIWKDATSGILGSDLYMTGDLTNGAGDPYTYRKSGSKYRVISGPDPKAIGKTFSLSPAPSVEVVSPKTKMTTRKIDISNITLGEYKKFLTAKQQAVFEAWPIFKTNEEMLLRDFMKIKNLKELAINQVKKLQYIAKDENRQPGSFRAPASLINIYATQSPVEAAGATLDLIIDTIRTPELEAFYEEQNRSLSELQ